MTTLHAAAHPGLPLAEALATCVRASKLAEATALLTAPSRYDIALVGADGGCRTPQGPAQLSEVYEARVFTADAELRWREEPGAPGRAVLLTEEPALLPPEFPETDGLELEAVGTLTTHQLLWGQATEGAGKWTTLTGASVTLRVPVQTTARARLAARQYIAVEPEHGNAYVAEERLLRIEPYYPLSELRDGDGQ